MSAQESGQLSRQTEPAPIPLLKGRKILFVVNDPAFFVSHRMILGQALLARDAVVGVVSPEGPGISEIRSAGLSHYPIPMHRWRSNPFVEIRSLYSLIRLFRNIKPDIVHNVTVKPVIYSSLAARITGVPALVNAVSGLGFVFISTGFRAQIRRLIVKRLYQLALSHRNSAVIFQNRDDEGTFVQDHLVDPRACTIIRGSGVNPEEFCPRPQENESNAKAVVVVMVSRLLRDKGVREFVAAASYLLSKGVSARFIHIGEAVPDNPAGVPLDEIQKWKDEGNVEFRGHSDKIQDVLAIADIACLPSYREGLPKALIEAAACGLPIVTTAAPGCREIVKHGVNGLLVPVRDAQGLAMALEDLILSPSRRETMGKKSRELFLHEGFTENDVVEGTLDTYQRLFSGS